MVALAVVSVNITGRIKAMLLASKPNKIIITVIQKHFTPPTDHALVQHGRERYQNDHPKHRKTGHN